MECSESTLNTVKATAFFLITSLSYIAHFIASVNSENLSWTSSAVLCILSVTTFCICHSQRFVKRWYLFLCFSLLHLQLAAAAFVLTALDLDLYFHLLLYGIGYLLTAYSLSTIGIYHYLRHDLVRRSEPVRKV